MASESSPCATASSELCTDYSTPPAEGTTPGWKCWIYRQGDHEAPVTQTARGAGLGLDPRRLGNRASPVTSTATCPHHVVLSFSSTHEAGVLAQFPGGTRGKEPACQGRRCKRRRFDPWVGKISWRRKWQPAPVTLPGESSLLAYSPGGRKELDKTEHAHTQQDKNIQITENSYQSLLR